MLIKAALVAALLGTAVSAVAVPANLPNGVYSQSFEEGSKPVFIRSLGESKANSALNARFVLPSDADTECTNGFLDIPSMQAAQAGFYNTPGVCDGVWRTQRITYEVQGTVVVYMCNYSNNPCAPNEFDLANGLLDGKCGSWKSGYVWIKSWAKTYGREDYLRGEGANICGRQIV